MKRRFLLLLMLTLLVTFLYALTVPTRSGGGYQFRPLHAMELLDERTYPLYEGGLPSETVAATSSDFLAYIDLQDGRIRSVHRRAFNMAVTPWGFANYGEAPSGVMVQSPDGRPIFSLTEPGYPLGRGGGLFQIHANGYGLSEYDTSGRRLWSFGGVSPVTAFDAIAGRRVVGFFGGGLFHRFSRPEDGGGEEAPWTPVKLPPAETELVYDVAFTPKGEALLVRSGLEPQSVSYFDLEVGLAEPRWTYEPAVASMRPEVLALLTAGEVAVEVSQEVHLLRRDTGALLRRIEAAELGDVVEFRETGLSMYLLSRENGSREELRLLESSGRELFLSSSVEPGLRLQREGTLLILARGSRLALVEVARQ